jgi:hypothetical protein
LVGVDPSDELAVPTSASPEPVADDGIPELPGAGLPPGALPVPVLVQPVSAPGRGGGGAGHAVTAVEAHETILIDAHDATARTAECGDDGTIDLLVSQVIRTGERQAWFLAEHLVDTPLVRA